MVQEFISQSHYHPYSVEVEASCPSNIALIKYWGKFAGQLPANPSISYTLNYCKTNTNLQFSPNQNFSVKTFLDGQFQASFSEKISIYFKNIAAYLPWITEGSFEINTQNTFPHSSGIASSASGFGAIAKALLQMDERFSETAIDTDFRLKKSSFLARLGSGSACRSLYTGLVVWGKTSVVVGSSDLYAVPYPMADIHSVFNNFNDWVLLIHEGQKSVSSSLGHSLMNGHPYAEARFQEAKNNFVPLKEILKTGNLEDFIQLVEHEALCLHAMMMMSQPAFVLMKTGTLEVIHRIWEFRKDTKLPLFFTLDAGANIHLLFPSGNNLQEAPYISVADETRIKDFIQAELLPYTQNQKMISDTMNF